jgi:phospholipid/cholesterol/gamma-HCH transport system ATP-binding protein
VIRLEGVSKSYNAAPVLADVGLEVPRGCLYGLIGPGASGKSVLLKMLAGLVVPERGRVVIDGVDLASLSGLDLQQFRKRFGMLFQNNALFDYLSVGDNIAFPLRRLTDWTDEQIRERVLDRLRAVSLSGFEDRLCAGLSGGQKKRVGVARATVMSGAEIVLYDEPAAGLDPVTSQRIFELLKEEQRASGATVLMVSSDLDRMLSVTDRVGMLHRGRLVFDGTTDEAKASQDPLVRQFVHGLVDGPL